MGEIYAQAEQIIVWLGEERSTDALAFSSLEKLDRYFENENSTADDRSSIPGGILFSDPLETDEWVALGRLLNKKWFSRVWTIQEVVLAKRSLVVCGRLSLDFEKLSDLTSILIQSTQGGMLGTIAPCYGPRAIMTMRLIERNNAGGVKKF